MDVEPCLASESWTPSGRSLSGGRCGSSARTSATHPVALELEEENLPQRIRHPRTGPGSGRKDGGTASAAAFHVARTVCRRAERAVVRLAAASGESVEKGTLRYLNRLSDLLFVIARHGNARQGVADVAWTRRA